MNITNDNAKKQLVEKLIKEGKITLDEGLQLLSNDGEFQFSPTFVPINTPYTSPYTYPNPLTPFTYTVPNNWNLFKVTC